MTPHVTICLFVYNRPQKKMMFFQLKIENLILNKFYQFYFSIGTTVRFISFKKQSSFRSDLPDGYQMGKTFINQET